MYITPDAVPILISSRAILISSVDNEQKKSWQVYSRSDASIFMFTDLVKSLSVFTFDRSTILAAY